MLPLATTRSLDAVTTLLAEVVGVALLAATLAGAAAFCYRWYVRESIPLGLSLLVGLSAVAVYLSTTTLLGEVIDSPSGPTDIEEALFHIVAFAGAALAAGAGRRIGDRFAEDVFSATRIGGVEAEVGRIVKNVGRVTTVELPDHIEDVVGYDPVAEETKEVLAGKRFVFPRRLTVDELERRLVSRLKTDYAVGHVDVELADDGSVAYLALGSRAAGIGPTLPPATNAVAIRADPAFAASAGDLVQVWETDPMRRILTAELRGVSGDIVTIAIDAADTSKIDPTTRYRLVTLPVDDRPEREFASLLRAADETFSSVTVEAGSPLHGLPVGALSVTVVSVKGDAAEPAILPGPKDVLEAGDVVFAIARPEALRRLEAAAEPLAPSIESEVVPGGDASAIDDGEASPAEALAASPSQGDDEAPTEGDGAADDEGAAEPSSPQPAAEEGDGDDQPASAPEQPATADAGDEGDGGDLADDGDEGDDGDEVATPEAGVRGQADESSFSQFKDEFDSGEADWDEDRAAAGAEDSGPDDAPPNAEDASEDESQSDEQTDGPDPEAAPPSDDGDDDDGLADLGDDLAGLGDELEDLGDDLEAVGAEADLDDLPDFDAEEVGEAFGAGDSADGGGDVADDDTSPDENSDDDGDDEEAGDESDEDEDSGGGDDDADGGDSGGGKSFAELKAEFEAGEADWEDEISDSPGGDMRLDE